MKNLSAAEIWAVFRERQWTGDWFIQTIQAQGFIQSTPMRWFTKDGLRTSLHSQLESGRVFSIYSTDPLCDFSETMPQTVVDAKTLSEWIDSVEMKYKFMRL